MTGETEDLVSAEEASYLQKSAGAGARGKLGELPVAELPGAGGSAAGLDERRVAALEAAASRLAEGLTASLTAVLGDQTTVSASGPRFGSIEDYRSSLPESSERVLRGPGPGQWIVLAVPQALAEEILDRMLGAGEGAGAAVTEGEQPKPRKLTRVDDRLLDELYGLVSQEWAGVLPGVEALQIAKTDEGEEPHPGKPDRSRGAPPGPDKDTGPGDPENVIVDFDVEGSAFAGLVRATCPLGFLIDTGGNADGCKREAQAPRRRLPLSRLLHVSVGLSARLGSVALLSSDLASLRPEMIVPLNTPPDGPVEVVVADRTWFEGRLARDGDRMVLEIARATQRSHFAE